MPPGITNLADTVEPPPEPRHKSILAQEKLPTVETPYSRPGETNAQGVVILREIADSAADLHRGTDSAEEDLAIIAGLAEAYRKIFGRYPTGGVNGEIMDSLRGRNDRNLAVIDPEHPDIGQQGDLVDRWGTPYYFHSVSRNELEIRSAGPDRKLWTEDDVTLE